MLARSTNQFFRPLHCENCAPRVIFPAFYMATWHDKRVQVSTAHGEHPAATHRATTMTRLLPSLPVTRFHLLSWAGTGGDDGRHANLGSASPPIRYLESVAFFITSQPQAKPIKESLAITTLIHCTFIWRLDQESIPWSVYGNPINANYPMWKHSFCTLSLHIFYIKA